jgi:hypothetical protein
MPSFTPLQTKVLRACKELDGATLNHIIAPEDFSGVIQDVLGCMDPVNTKALATLETLFQNNTQDTNFSTALLFSIARKDYDLARLILKYSRATVLMPSALSQYIPHDDIYRECAVRAVRNCLSDDFGVIPEILCRATTSDTIVAILQEIPHNYEVDKHFMEALMYREQPGAIEFAVERFIGSNPNLATDVITFILSGEVEQLDDLIVPLLKKYPPNEQQKKWISSSINPRWCPIPILEELLNYYVVEDNARLLLEASASQNPIVFSKVVRLFTEEQARNLLEVNKAVKLFSPKTFDADRELLRQHIEHLDNLKQQSVLNNSISCPQNKNSARKM